jgi:hypothetical protein
MVESLEKIAPDLARDALAEQSAEVAEIRSRAGPCDRASLLTMASKPTTHPELPAPYPNIFIDERSGMYSLGYLAALQEIDDAIDAQAVTPAGAPALINQSAESLRSALAEGSHDHALIRERALALAADAIRSIKAIGEAGELGGSYVSPTIQRLAGLIEDHAPRVGDLTPIGTDDLLGRWGDEILGAAGRFTEARPHTLSGSARGRVKNLYRIVALAAHGIAALSDRDRSR